MGVSWDGRQAGVPQPRILLWQMVFSPNSLGPSSELLPTASKVWNGGKMGGKMAWGWKMISFNASSWEFFDEFFDEQKSHVFFGRNLVKNVFETIVILVSRFGLKGIPSTMATHRKARTKSHGCSCRIIQESLNYPFPGGSTKMQMFGNFEGFHFYFWMISELFARNVYNGISVFDHAMFWTYLNFSEIRFD